MIYFNCKKCGEKMEAPLSLSGEVLKCPQCRASCRVPSQAQAVAPGPDPVQDRASTRQTISTNGRFSLKLWVVAGVMVIAGTGGYMAINNSGAKHAMHAQSPAPNVVSATQLPALSAPIPAKLDLPRLDKAIGACEAFDAKLEIGMNYRDYGNALGELWAVCKPAVTSPTSDEIVSGIPLDLMRAVDYLKNANDEWSKSIDTESERMRAIYDFSRQVEWDQAACCIHIARMKLEGRSDEIKPLRDQIDSDYKRIDDFMDKLK